MIKLYNSLTKRKEEFNPANEDGVVRMYSCGPTVYKSAQIGNMRSYVFMDIIKRVFLYNGYHIINVMNITDVGHLTDDADAGEDKMEKSAREQKRSVWDIAKYYTDEFMIDLKRLNILMPTYITKATDHIKEMIDIIKVLEEKGYTYKISDGIYFDVSKFSNYGQLSGMKLDDKRVGASERVEVNAEKHSPHDFALWKYVEPNHTMKWDSPWGVGCPGWHIECSAMSRKYLGDNFDIHTGGIDAYSLHHENEIAQNDCSCGHQVVKTWMHCEYLLADNRKMSKSLGNGYTLSELVALGYDPLDFRYFLLLTDFRKTVNFTIDGLNSAKTALSRLRSLVQSNKGIKVNLTASEIANLTKFGSEFTEAINNDLNIPYAIGVMWNMLKTLPKSEDVYEMVLKFDKVLGLSLDREIEQVVDKIPSNIIELAEKRKEAKLNKNFALSDQLRNEINSLGYEIKDLPKAEYEITKK